MATTKHNPPPISGCVHAATVNGFLKLIAEANRVEADGYELVTIVRLDTQQIAGVFRRRPQPREAGGFFE
jgi:hypothetical protein